MTTTISDDKLRHKALMYVFGRRVPKIVDVIEEPGRYLVKCEDFMNPGRYYWRFFHKDEDGIGEQIDYAINQLTWIAEGNEFPTK